MTINDKAPGAITEDEVRKILEKQALIASPALVLAVKRLLHARGHPGRHGMRKLGPSITGALRSGEHGLLAPDLLRGAELVLEDRRRDNDGADPPDWRMSEMLEGMCEHFASTHGSAVRAVFKQAEVDYAQLFTSGELMSRRRLIESVSELTEANTGKDAEIAELRRQLDELRARHAAIAATAANAIPDGIPDQKPDNSQKPATPSTYSKSAERVPKPVAKLSETEKTEPNGPPMEVD